MAIAKLGITPKRYYRYMDDVDTSYVSTGTLFAAYTIPKKVKPLSERAELVAYFYEKAKVAWAGTKPLKPAFIAFKLSHLSIRDLYTFKSTLTDQEKRGYCWAKAFYGSLKCR